MNLKALLVCDDIRVEVAGKLTAVGIYNERLVVGPGEGPVFMPKLAILVVVAGLTGARQISCRHRILRVGDVFEAPPRPFETHEHAGAYDEHNFIFAHSPMHFPAAGDYTVVVEVRTEAESAVYNYPFKLERAQPEMAG